MYSFEVPITAYFSKNNFEQRAYFFKGIRLSAYTSYLKMNSKQIPHPKASGSKDENETNWPVVILLLTTMAALFLLLFISF